MRIQNLTLDIHVHVKISLPNNDSFVEINYGYY